MLLALWTLTDEESQRRILQIYYQYHDDMIRFARARLRRMGDANEQADSEDVVQNAFVKIIKYIHAIDLQRGEKQLRVYLFSIVANEVNAFLSDREELAELDDAQMALADADFFAGLPSQGAGVLEAMRSLDVKYLSVLWYRYYQNYDIAQISRMLGISEKAVYTRILRAKNMLRERLGKEK